MGKKTDGPSRRDDGARDDIDAARRHIDRLDDEILTLLNRRAAEVQRIGHAKRLLGEPIYQPDREEAIFDRLLSNNGGPLDDGAVRRLFERILDEARRLERTTYQSDDEEI